MTAVEQGADRRTWWAIVAILLAALVLRFICAQGDLWLDEAMGSEARGYANMALAMLVAILFNDPWPQP